MSVIWLQEYLSTFQSTILVVAHDREFVDNIAQELIVLRNKTLTYFDGNLTDYQRETRIKLKGQIKMKEAMDRKKEAVTKTIEQGYKTARKTGDDGKARMAKSRQKKLDDRWGLERSEKGGRWVPTSVRRRKSNSVLQLQTEPRSRRLSLDISC